MNQNLQNIELLDAVKMYPSEIKAILANILEANYTNAVSIWNNLHLEPEIKNISLENNTLVISLNKNDELLINFDKLLDDIQSVLEM